MKYIHHISISTPAINVCVHTIHIAILLLTANVKNCFSVTFYRTQVSVPCVFFVLFNQNRNARVRLSLFAIKKNRQRLQNAGARHCQSNTPVRTVQMIKN